MGSPPGALDQVGIGIPAAAEELDASPPGIEVIRVEPPVIAIGPECPGAPGTTQVAVWVVDNSPIQGVVAAWQLGDRQWETFLEQIDDQTYSGTLGPVETTGEMLVTIFAEDAFGNVGETKFIVEVANCIG